MFTNVVKNIEALAGETVDLRCDMSRIGVEVTWLKDNKPLSMADSRFQIVNQDNQTHLVIFSVSPDDAGEYTVQVEDQQFTFLLIVNGQ